MQTTLEPKFCGDEDLCKDKTWVLQSSLARTVNNDHNICTSLVKVKLKRIEKRVSGVKGLSYTYILCRVLQNSQSLQG